MRAHTIEVFREFAEKVRQPAPYRPLITEAKGVTNLALGSLEVIASQCCIRRGKLRDQISRFHLQKGKETFRTGLEQLVPAFKVTGALFVSLGSLYLVHKIQ